MPIRPGTILPGVSPICSCTDNRHGSVDSGRFQRCSVSQRSAKVTRPEQSQRIVAWIEVVYASRKAGQIGAYDIQLELVERAGARSGAEVNFTCWIGFLFRDAGRKIQEAREIFYGRNLFSISSNTHR